MESDAGVGMVMVKGKWEMGNIKRDEHPSPQYPIMYVLTATNYSYSESVAVPLPSFLFVLFFFPSSFFSSNEGVLRGIQGFWEVGGLSPFAALGSTVL